MAWMKNYGAYEQFRLAACSEMSSEELSLEQNNYYRTLSMKEGNILEQWQWNIDAIEAELGRRALPTEQSLDLAGHIWRSRDGE